MLIEYLEKNNIERLALVGTNSQGKSYAISQEFKGNIAKQAIQNEIDKIVLSSINCDSFLNISINNNLDSYKGIINAEIKTDSNQWKKPGSGERFLG